MGIIKFIISMKMLIGGRCVTYNGHTQESATLRNKHGQSYIYLFIPCVSRTQLWANRPNLNYSGAFKEAHNSFSVF